MNLYGVRKVYVKPKIESNFCFASVDLSLNNIESYDRTLIV